MLDTPLTRSLVDAQREYPAWRPWPRCGKVLQSGVYAPDTRDFLRGFRVRKNACANAVLLDTLQVFRRACVRHREVIARILHNELKESKTTTHANWLFAGTRTGLACITESRFSSVGIEQYRDIDLNRLHQYLLQEREMAFMDYDQGLREKEITAYGFRVDTIARESRELLHDLLVFHSIVKKIEGLEGFKKSGSRFYCKKNSDNGNGTNGSSDKRFGRVKKPVPRHLLGMERIIADAKRQGISVDELMRRRKMNAAKITRRRTEKRQ
jgi:hypothetical protein